MANTKIDLVAGSYSRMRISGLTIDPTPEDTTLALRRLELMMAEWEGRNITMQYRFAIDEGDIDPNSETGILLKYQDSIESNLAVKLSPDFGMDVPMSLGQAASLSLSSVSSMIAADNIRMVQPPTRQPIGDATTSRQRIYQRFYRPAPQPPQDAALHDMFTGDINLYEEDYTAYLVGGETIVSTVFKVDEGLKLITDAIVDQRVLYTIQALSPTASGVWQVVRIILTTSTGRVTTRLINFDVRIPGTLEGVTY
ncbi:MAG: hypothetical protein JKY14_13735 [Paraglaciecola sp.]|nr:hypothetical protein [Paraglaciecola sp.]